MDAIERLRRRVEEYERVKPRARPERRKIDLGLTREEHETAQAFDLYAVKKLEAHAPSLHRKLVLAMVHEALTDKEVMHRLIPTMGMDGARAVLSYEGIWFPNL